MLTIASNEPNYNKTDTQELSNTFCCDPIQTFKGAILETYCKVLMK